MILAIDMGGTNVKYGFVDSKGKLFSLGKFKTPPSYELLLEKIEEIINNYSLEKIEGIAVSTAGVVHKNGIIDGISGIKYILKTNLEEIFYNKFQTKISVENDANCTSLSYLWEHKNISSLISIAFGTGLGGSIIINNHLYKGNNDFAGELGLTFLQTPQKMSSVEDELSTNNVLKKINKHLDKPIDGKEAFILYKNNDLLVKKYFDIWFENIVHLLINLEFLLNPEIILLTGGVTEEKLFLEEILKIHKEIIDKERNFELKTKIICSKHMNNANVLGAAYKWYEIYN